MIRRCVPSDVPWLVDLAREAYAPWLDEWNEPGARQWVEMLVKRDDVVALRGEQTVGFADIIVRPWAPTNRWAELLHLWGKERWGWEAFHVVQKLEQVCRGLGCARFIIGSIYRDVSPIAKRLGGRRISAVWVVEA